jgi:hypothetical protein
MRVSQRKWRLRCRPIARFAGKERDAWQGVLMKQSSMASLPDVSQKDLPEGSLGVQMRVAHAIHSDIDQELLEERIA